MRCAEREGELPLFVDSTLLALAERCPRKFLFEQVLARPAGGAKSVDLHAGAAFAAGLEAARLGKDVFEAFSAAWGDPDQFADETKNAIATAKALEHYLHDVWPIADDEAQVATIEGRPMVEVAFEVPLVDIAARHPSGQPFVLVGRPDTVVEYAGDLWVLDEKTTGSAFKPSWASQWARRGQFSAYTWGLGQLGVRVAGTLVRGISITRTASPPRSVQSITAHRDVLTTMGKKWHYTFDYREHATARPPFMVEEWLGQVDLLLGEIVRAWESGNWRASSLDAGACSAFGRPCEYLEACTGGQPLRWLERLPHARWSPRTRELEVLAD